MGPPRSAGVGWGGGGGGEDGGRGGKDKGREEGEREAGQKEKDEGRQDKGVWEGGREGRGLNKSQRGSLQDMARTGVGRTLPWRQHTQCKGVAMVMHLRRHKTLSNALLAEP